MKMQPLLCKNGHRLGDIYWNGKKVPQLMIYREAVEAAAECPADVLGPVTGEMNIPCSICQEVRVWGVNMHVVLYLTESMPDKMLFEFWQELLARAKTEKQVEKGEAYVQFDG